MTIHRYHPDPDTDDPQTALVYDDCTRCDEIAQDPRSLDHIRLPQAYARAKQDDWSGTKNEYQLFKLMYMIWVVNQHLGLDN